MIAHCQFCDTEFLSIEQESCPKCGTEDFIPITPPTHTFILRLKDDRIEEDEKNLLQYGTISYQSKILPIFFLETTHPLSVIRALPYVERANVPRTGRLL
ncbi:hypothetical protein ACFYKX_10710 [Cytobacillus sp. FJAT-54145]|uniref:DUF35 domain-containing protein n=1 Tax=Cytobacillus spartinae TaxID=3299023 RepID=A0ABW6KA34_9BACI